MLRSFWSQEKTLPAGFADQTSHPQQFDIASPYGPFVRPIRLNLNNIFIETQTPPTPMEEVNGTHQIG